MFASFVTRFSPAILLSLTLHAALLSLPWLASSSLLPISADQSVEFYTVSLVAHASTPAEGSPNGTISYSPIGPAVNPDTTAAKKTTAPVTAPVAAPTIPPIKATQTETPAKKAKVQSSQVQPAQDLPIEPTNDPQSKAPQTPETNLSSGATTAGSSNGEEHSSEAATTGEAGRARLGVVDGTGSEQGVPYEQIVVSALARQKRYPDSARRKGVTGEGTLRLVLEPSGSVEAASVVQSTGSELLDDEISQMVERAAPFPASPPNYPSTRLEFLVPVKFALQ